MSQASWRSILFAAAALLLAACQTSAPIPADRLPGEAVPLVSDIQHIAYLGAEHTPYNSVPPTSGPHVAQTIAPGVYREEIPEELQVHALEHGHVLIQFAPALPPDDVHTLLSMARAFPRDVIVAPYSKLPSGIALTAWGRIERLERVDTDKITLFVISMAGRYNHGWQRP